MRPCTREKVSLQNMGPTRIDSRLGNFEAIADGLQCWVITWNAFTSPGPADSTRMPPMMPSSAGMATMAI